MSIGINDELPNSSFRHYSWSNIHTQAIFVVISITFLIVLIAGIAGYLLGRRLVNSTVTSSPNRSVQVQQSTPTSILPSSLWGRGNIVQPCNQLFPPDSKDLDVDQTWKTYTSAQYHFSIKYPDAWIVSENSSAGSIVFSKLYSSTSEVHPVITVYISSKTELNPNWGEQYTPFYGATVLQWLGKTYIFTVHHPGPLIGGDLTTYQRNIKLGPRILCGMLSTFRPTK